jgi:hypothetical protein
MCKKTAKEMALERATNQAEQDCHDRTQRMNLLEPENRQDWGNVLKEKFHGLF